MGKTISSLSIILGATVAPFVSAFAGARSAVGSFTSTVGAAGSSVLTLTGIGGALAAALGGAGLGVLITDQFAAIGSTNKLAKRLGVTAESMTGLQHAALMAGVDQGALTGGMEKMLKTLGAAAAGSSQASGAFALLGLDAAKLANEAPDQALQEIADKLKAIENPAQRALAATKIFGKGGQQLLPLLTQGSEGIKAASDEAKRMGLTFNAVDAGKIKEATSAMKSVRESAAGLFRSVAIAIAPFVSTFAQAFAAVTVRIHDTAREWLPPIINVVSAIWSGITSTFAAILTFVTPIVTAIGQYIADNWQTALTITVGVFSSIYGAIASVLGVVWQLVSAVWSDMVLVWTAALNAIGIQTNLSGITIQGVFQGIVAIAKWLADGITAAMIVAGYAITHWRDVLELATVEAALFIVRTGNQISYVFTEVVPALLTWFFDNWKDIFTTLWNFTSSVFLNMGKNVENFFSALWSFLKGDGFDFQWTGLLDGFESTIKDLPKIAERQVGPIESALQTHADSLSSGLATGVGQALADQQAQAKKIASTIQNGVSNAIAGVPAPAAAATAAAPTPQFTTPTETAKKNQKSEQNDAVRAGTAEAQRLAFATPMVVGKSDDLAKQQLAEQKTANKTLSNIAASVDAPDDAEEVADF